METIRKMVDVNTIIGDPISCPDGTIIIPVSKVGFGFAAGGSDWPSKTPKDLFGGGTGAGVSIQPIAFLVISNGEVRLLKMEADASAISDVIEAIPSLITMFTSMVGKKEKKEKEPSKEE